jgi:4-amino-4-deoxy-L-arabinose transferase-like glycosyltransferase
VPDEAFYWVLSRHLATGYLDHPPMVAYVIRIGTMLFGSNEVGVRCGAVVMAFGSLLILLAMCRRAVGGGRATALLGVTWLCGPLFAGLGAIMTPDTPAIFFSMAAMACAFFAVGSIGVPPMPLSDNHRRNTNATRLWILFGLCTGLAMMSKYTAILPAGAVFLALLTSVEGRREFRKPGVWLAVLAALIVFSPVIHWNATHQWASFRFQLHHGLDDAESTEILSNGGWLAIHLGSLAKYLVGQIGFFTPVFFVFGVVVLAIRWRHYRELSPSFRILVWSSTVPLLFFGFTAFKSGNPGEGNWPAFGYFPMSLLTIEHIARRWKPLDIKLILIGSGVALAITIGLHSPDLLYKLTKDRLPFPRKLNEFYGWRKMAEAADRARRMDRGLVLLRPAPVVAGRHQDAAELSFYLPGQPDVWVYPLADTGGNPDSRPTAFDYFPDRPDIAKADRVLFFHGHIEDFCRTFGFVTNGEIGGWSEWIHGRSRDRRYEMVVRRK